MYQVRRYWLVVLFSALVIQLSIISYNNYSGFIHITTLLELLIRILFGTAVSFLFGMLLLFQDLKIIKYLDKNFLWADNPAKRVMAEVTACIAVAVNISFFATLISHLVSPYDKGFTWNFINNALIISVVNLLSISCLEAYFFFISGQQAKLKSETLLKEVAQMQFEVLKNQINPHFMFNSLNVLSGLINKDTKLAQHFIDEFSLIYRYVLESIEKPVVSLQDELEFAKSYVFLQNVRYGSCLIYTVKIDGSLLNYLLPPLSLQTLLENAIKHNIVAPSQPLYIELVNVEEILVIKNNLQRKNQPVTSSHIGQKNLFRRYELLGAPRPVVEVSETSYIVKLPLIYPSDI